MSEALESGAKTITAAELFGSTSEKPASEKPQDENAEGKANAESSGAQKDEKTAAKDENEAKGTSEEGEDPEETDGEADPDSYGDEPKEEKVSGVEKRIKKLVKKNQQARQEADYWREEAMRAKNQQDPKSQRTQEKAQDAEPNADDFENYQDYQNAVIQHNIKKALNPALDEIKKSFSGSKDADDSQKAAKAFGARIKEFTKENKDYQEVIQSLNGINVDKSVEQTLVQSEHGPAILYELGKNPDLAADIAEMPPHLQMKEIGKLEARIEARIEAKKNPPPPKTTKAPAPPSPVGGKSEGKKSVTDANISPLDFIKLRNEEEKQRRNQFL